MNLKEVCQSYARAMGAEMLFSRGIWLLGGERTAAQNASRLAAGIAAFSKKRLRTGKIIIGCHAARQEEAAVHAVFDALSDSDLDVYLAEGDVTLPMLAHGVAGANADLGVEIEGTGIGLTVKAVLGDGTERPMEESEAIEALVPKVRKVEYSFDYRTLNVSGAYADGLKALAPDAGGAGAKIDIAESGPGAGALLAKALTAKGFKAVVNKAGKGDSREEAIQGLSALTAKNGSIGIYIEDGMQFFAMAEGGKAYDINAIGSALADHLIKDDAVQGDVCKSATATEMLDEIAGKNYRALVEMPSGQASGALGRGAFIAVDYENGIGVSSWLRCLDANAAALLAIGMAIKNGGLAAMASKLAADYGERSFVSYSAENALKEREDMEFLLNDPERKEIGGRNIVQRENIDGMKLLLEDGSWVLFRESDFGGKDLQVFIEAGAASEAKELKGAVDRFLGLKFA